MINKASKAYQTITEVSKSLDIPSHVMRFWESKFLQLKPMKRSGGRRYYQNKDIKLLQNIKVLLYDKGFTIKGAQKILSAKNIINETNQNNTSNNSSIDQSELEDIKKLYNTLLKIELKLNKIINYF